MKNIVSGGMLRAMGYGLELLRVPKIVELNTGREVLVGNYDEHGGMPWVALHDVLNLPCISSCHYVMGGGSSEVMLSDTVQQDPLNLLHERAGHVAKRENYWRLIDIC